MSRPFTQLFTAALFASLLVLSATSPPAPKAPPSERRRPRLPLPPTPKAPYSGRLRRVRLPLSTPEARWA